MEPMCSRCSLKYIITVMIACLLMACTGNDAQTEHTSTRAQAVKQSATLTAKVIIEVQPFTGMPAGQVSYVLNELRKVYPHVVLRNNIALPRAVFYAKRKRYRADSLISYLKHMPAPSHVIVGLTQQDISTTKGDIADWGVMGLGACPGNACVVSTFRLSKKNLSDQLFKVVIHEIGHTQGLQHCPIQTCYMRDAEGGNPTDQETGFCEKCKEVLASRGRAFR